MVTVSELIGQANSGSSSALDSLDSVFGSRNQERKKVDTALPEDIVHCQIHYDFSGLTEKDCIEKLDDFKYSLNKSTTYLADKLCIQEAKTILSKDLLSLNKQELRVWLVFYCLTVVELGEGMNSFKKFYKAYHNKVYYDGLEKLSILSMQLSILSGDVCINWYPFELDSCCDRDWENYSHFVKMVEDLSKYLSKQQEVMPGCIDIKYQIKEFYKRLLCFWFLEEETDDLRLYSLVTSCNLFYKIDHRTSNDRGYPEYSDIISNREDFLFSKLDEIVSGDCMMNREVIAFIKGAIKFIGCKYLGDIERTNDWIRFNEWFEVVNSHIKEYIGQLVLEMFSLGKHESILDCYWCLDCVHGDKNESIHDDENDEPITLKDGSILV